MQEGVNADGGYAVPEDIVTAIIDRRDSKESLLGEVRVVKVNQPRAAAAPSRSAASTPALPPWPRQPSTARWLRLSSRP